MYNAFREVYAVLSSWFYPDMAHGVFWGSFLVTFVASVMGKDQQERFEKGTFGLAAGTSLGGISGLLNKQPELLVVGFVASALGGLLGWLYYLGLAICTLWFHRTNTLVVFQSGGLEELRKKLDIDSKENLKTAFDGWTGKFAQVIAREESELLKCLGTSTWEENSKQRIRGWLTSAVDTLALVFGTLLDEPKQYQSRVTLIVYGLGIKNPKAPGKSKKDDKDKDHGATEIPGGKEPLGKHWIGYVGQLKPHSNLEFDRSSIGYKVLCGECESPYFTTAEKTKSEGQHRTDPSYRPFITFRLNDSAILALDWPQELKETDKYVVSAQALFYSRVAPAITHILDNWPRPLASVVGLEPLSDGHPGS